MAEKRRQLRWRRQPRATGLASVCQGERGYELTYGGERVASVAPAYKGWSREREGYYWSALSDALGVALRNTAGEGLLYETIEEAKEACRAYVREQLEEERKG